MTSKQHVYLVLVNEPSWHLSATSVLVPDGHDWSHPVLSQISIPTKQHKCWVRVKDPSLQLLLESVLVLWGHDRSQQAQAHVK